MKPCTVPGFICGGWVKDAHSLKGQLYIQVYSPSMDWADQFEQLHLYNEKKELRLTYKVREWKPFKKGFLIAVDELKDRTAAEQAKGFYFLIPEEWLEADEGDPVFLLQLKGFEVFDKDRRLGVVDDFATNTVQDLLMVGEIMIPFIEEFILEVDFENKKIRMDLPEGLYEV